MAEEKEQINPSDIIFEDEDTMPVPETDNYSEQPAQQTQKQDDGQTKILRPSPKFLKLFEECVGKLPYNTILTNSNNEKIKLTSLFQYVNAKQNGMTVGDMNAIIAFIAPIEYNIIKPLMEIIDEASRQKELWTIE